MDTYWPIWLKGFLWVWGLFGWRRKYFSFRFMNFGVCLVLLVKITSPPRKSKDSLWNFLVSSLCLVTRETQSVDMLITSGDFTFLGGELSQPTNYPSISRLVRGFFVKDICNISYFKHNARVPIPSVAISGNHYNFLSH